MAKGAGIKLNMQILDNSVLKVISLLISLFLLLNCCMLDGLAEDRQFLSGIKWDYVFFPPSAQAIVEAVYQNSTEKNALRAENHPDENWIWQLPEQLSWMATFEELKNEEYPLVVAPAPLRAGEQAGWEFPILSLDELYDIYEFIPIAYDAVSFLVNVENPIDEITVDDIKRIYSGTIKNWQLLGGEDRTITAFQRELSYCQMYMEHVVMQGMDMTVPPKVEVRSIEGDKILTNAPYDNGLSSVGYKLYRWTKGMYEGENIKLLNVDGIAISNQSIQDGSYPFRITYYAIFLKTTPHEHPIRRLVEWMCGAEGQSIISNTGFIPCVTLLLDENTTQESERVTPQMFALGTGSFAQRGNNYMPGQSEDNFDVYPLSCSKKNNISNIVLQKKIDKLVACITSKKANRELIDVINKYYFYYQNLISVYVEIKDRESSHIITIVFDLEKGCCLQLSDLFPPNINYTRIINQSMLKKSMMYNGEAYNTFSFEDENLKRAFCGLPPDYPYFLVSEEGTLCILFNKNNPYVYTNLADWTSVFCVELENIIL